MIKQFIPAIVAIGLISGCASTPSDTPRGAEKYAEDARLGEQVDRICFNRNIDGFSHTDRDTVVVSAGVNEDYLLVVRGPCQNLRHAQAIGIDSALSCVTKFDRILVSTSAFSLVDNLGGPERCMIQEIYSWDEDAEDKQEEEKDSEAEETAAP